MREQGAIFPRTTPETKSHSGVTHGSMTNPCTVIQNGGLISASASAATATNAAIGMGSGAQLGDGLQEACVTLAAACVWGSGN